ncbi:MAG TPA: FAD-dependent oxidoreductase [Acetobacteraceae bacterium]|nr:FAD-dependent oxidoreductase [Acetobacteraceae bacterium]
MRADGLRIAVVGGGVAGLGCAWLLSERHRVTLYEAAPALGGHCRTVEVARPGGGVPVDMGFIVYNETTYPNLTALFDLLGVATQPSCMSLAISLQDGGFEYGGHDVGSLLAQKRNLLRPRFWSMLRHLRRLYCVAAGAQPGDEISLGDWLDGAGFPASFQRDHLLPMAAAIWSCSADAVRAQPAAAFLRFCDNHGLLRLRDRPVWRTVAGGARAYVSRLRACIDGEVLTGREVTRVTRDADGVTLRDADGGTRRFDHVVLATHGDTARALLADADDDEHAVLGAFRTVPNRAVLHGDASLMPRRRAAWSSWNFVASRQDTNAVSVTYWMNRLQSIPGADIFVTLNPRREPAPGLLHAECVFSHPLFDTASLLAQKAIWHVQGRRRTWFCGAWLGAGFHEDGLQAGLAVAEALGGVRRPWRVAGESGRIHLPPALVPA